MTRTLSRFSAAALLAASVALIAACSAPAEPAESSAPSGAPTPTTPAPTAEPVETSAPAGDPTCETIIPASTVEDFEGLGWSVKADPFRAGSTELEGGVQCTWGDYTVATDHVQIFGWAPITEDEADSAQAELVSSGWSRESTDTGIYVTESEETALATDAEGYGLTYLFGEGWVKYADTKQGLLLVEWPQG